MNSYLNSEELDLEKREIKFDPDESICNFNTWFASDILLAIIYFQNNKRIYFWNMILDFLNHESIKAVYFEI